MGIPLELLVPGAQVVKRREGLADVRGDVAGVALPFAFALTDGADDGFHAVEGHGAEFVDLGGGS